MQQHLTFVHHAIDAKHSDNNLPDQEERRQMQSQLFDVVQRRALDKPMALSVQNLQHQHNPADKVG